MASKLAASGDHLGGPAVRPIRRPEVRRLDVLGDGAHAVDRAAPPGPAHHQARPAAAGARRDDGRRPPTASGPSAVLSVATLDAVASVDDSLLGHEVTPKSSSTGT